MAENKTCKQCSKEFVVEDDDLLFYKKISPTFAGKTFEIPSPILCPECRQMTRQSWRNETSIYKRDSDKSGVEIVSMYSPDKKSVKVYSNDEWWSDAWSGLDYGRDFVPSRPFFDQFGELLFEVPRFALFNVNNENCPFANYAMDNKDCYMSFVSYYGCDNTHYSYTAFSVKDSVEVFKSEKVENCYRLGMSDECYNCFYSLRLHNCSDCWFSVDLIGCRNCIFCSNLSHKEFCIGNEQLTKEEYAKRLREYDFGSYDKTKEYLAKFNKLRCDSPVKFSNSINCENCEGDNHKDSRNLKKCFDQTRCENVKYSAIAVGCKDCQDVHGGDMDQCYLVITGGYGGNYVAAHTVEHCSNMYYSVYCFYCQDCFGCVGLHHKQYCIFNKQYPSKAEYEQKVSEIIAKMISDEQWGQFFPHKLSPFGFNETFASRNYKLTKEEALKLGFKWQDNDFGLQYEGVFYEPKDDIGEYQAEENRKSLLSGVLKCEQSGKPFKVISQELAFYLKHGLPIPRKHYKVRMDEMFEWSNPRQLWHRKCMNEGCQNEFETTYAPERPEKVYCEECYQKTVI